MSDNRHRNAIHFFHDEGIENWIFEIRSLDVLCNEIPLIFRKQIYATAGLVGGLAYIGLNMISVNDSVAMITSVVLIIAIRMLSVHFGWSMPVLTKEKEDYL